MDPVSFTLLHGNETQRFSLRPGEDDCVTIGRDPTSDLPVNLSGVSRNHAELRLCERRGEYRVAIVDLSSNATGLKAPDGSVTQLEPNVATEVPEGTLVVLPMKIKASEQDATDLRMAFAIEMEPRKVKESKQSKEVRPKVPTVPTVSTVSTESGSLAALLRNHEDLELKEKQLKAREEKERQKQLEKEKEREKERERLREMQKEWELEREEEKEKQKKSDSEDEKKDRPERDRRDRKDRDDRRDDRRDRRDDRDRRGDRDRDRDRRDGRRDGRDGRDGRRDRDREDRYDRRQRGGSRRRSPSSRRNVRRRSTPPKRPTRRPSPRRVERSRSRDRRDRRRSPSEKRPSRRKASSSRSERKKVGTGRNFTSGPEPTVSQDLLRELSMGQGGSLSLPAPRPGVEMCADFKRGACHRGERCKFSHDGREPGVEICADFKRGACFREHCKFAHEGGTSLGPSLPSLSSSLTASLSALPSLSARLGLGLEMCADFKRGACQRERCKFSHGDAPRHEVQPLSSQSPSLDVSEAAAKAAAALMAKETPQAPREVKSIEVGSDVQFPHNGSWTIGTALAYSADGEKLTVLTDSEQLEVPVASVRRPGAATSMRSPLVGGPMLGSGAGSPAVTVPSPFGGAPIQIPVPAPFGRPLLPTASAPLPTFSKATAGSPPSSLQSL